MRRATDIAQMHACQCLRCNHAWLSVDPQPNACARCKTRSWATPAPANRGGRGGSHPSLSVAMDAILGRLDALEAAIARLSNGQRQPAGTSQQAQDGRTLDYDAF